MKKGIEIIFEDENLIAVNKPAGVFTIDQRFIKEEPSLKAILEKGRDRLFVVHRLDKDTSGIIIFAKDEDSHRHLSLQFQHREIEKYYLAYVERTPIPAHGEIELALAESKTTRGKMVAHKRGKYAKSSYEVLESFKSFSILRVRIFTGRLHQIRVHLSSIGHPLIIDSLYGDRSSFFVSEIKGKKFNNRKFQEERPLMERHTLHAQMIVFRHPVSNEIRSLEAKIPKDLKALRNQLIKWNK